MDKYLTDLETAQLLGVRPQTLAVWRMNGRHNLPFVKVGRCVRYRLADINEWLQSRTMSKSTDTRELQTA